MMHPLSGGGGAKSIAKKLLFIHNPTDYKTNKDHFVLNMQVQGKRRRGDPRRGWGAGQYQGGHERVQDDGRHGTESKCVTHEDNVRPITTWRRTIGENGEKKCVAHEAGL